MEPIYFDYEKYPYESLPDVDVKDLPRNRVITSGVYFLLDGEEIVYVGKTEASVHARIGQHIQEGKKRFDSFKVIELVPKMCDPVENYFIKKFQPKYNSLRTVSADPVNISVSECMKLMKQIPADAKTHGLNVGKVKKFLSEINSVELSETGVVDRQDFQDFYFELQHLQKMALVDFLRNTESPKITTNRIRRVLEKSHRGALWEWQIHSPGPISYGYPAKSKEECEGSDYRFDIERVEDGERIKIEKFCSLDQVEHYLVSNEIEGVFDIYDHCQKEYVDRMTINL